MQSYVPLQASHFNDAVSGASGIHALAAPAAAEECTFCGADVMRPLAKHKADNFHCTECGNPT